MSLQITAKNEVPVFNLEVLVSRSQETGLHHARLANLELASPPKSTPREAIAAVVTDAKTRIREIIERGETIPWLVPPISPTVGETRLLVPIHL